MQGSTKDSPSESNLISTRTYTLVISYDKHYQVPRVWLIGYKEDGSLLSHEEVMEDVISDYFNHKDRKTVSIEQHPHRESGGTVVSIHPCRHAAVMKKLSSVVSGEGNVFDVEQYVSLKICVKNFKLSFDSMLQLHDSILKVHFICGPHH